MTTKKGKSAGAEKKGTVVYCGPTIPGVAKQYTIYNNGIPATLAERVKGAPEIRGLVVPLDQLPEAMKGLRGKQGHIYRLYRLVQAKNENGR